jgi:hypothetical protein
MSRHLPDVIDGEEIDESAGVCEGELRAGVGVFAASDHPKSVALGGEVDGLGDLGDFGAVAFVAAIGVHGWPRRRFGHADQHGCELGGEGAG